MPCNVTTQRRTKKWESMDSQNAPCRCQIGWRNSPFVPHQWWINWNIPQVADQWKFLDGGHVLTKAPGDAEGRCEFQADDLPSLLDINLNFLGNNFVTPGETPQGWTVMATIKMFNLQQAADPTLYEDKSEAFEHVPFASAIWIFTEFIEILPDPLSDSEIVGSARIWPLKACHTCTSGP